MILSSSPPRDERLSTPVASSEVSLTDISPHQSSILSGGAGTSAPLHFHRHVAFHRRSMSQALFAEEYPSLVSAIRARRASPDWRRLCFTNGALAFPSLHLALHSTHRARLKLVRRSRLLRLASSAFWCRSPSSFSVCPLLWGQLQPSELASHLSSATSIQLLYPRGKSVVDGLDESAPELLVDLRPLLAKVVLQSFSQLLLP